MPAGRYLLGAGHRVRVPLHQLLERDGLRVRSAGDLQTRENQSGLHIPPSSLLPSLARVLPQGGGPGWWVREPPHSRPEPSRRYLQPEERLQAALGGRRTCTRVCAPRSHKFPQEKGTPCRGGSGHTPGRPKCAGSPETARIALPRPAAGFTRG